VDNLTNLAGDKGVRLLMLGAPHRGMPAIVSMLTGFDSSLRRLALLDAGFPLSKVLTLFASFPGVLELLPEDPRWFSQNEWKGLRDANEGVGAIPTEESLHSAKAAIAVRNAEKISSSAWMSTTSVVGDAPGTVFDVTVDRNAIRIEWSERGDGRVPHASTILPGMDTYYADADHGELAANIELIPAYVELLESGFTTRLSRTAIGAATGAPETAPKATRSPRPVLFPTGGELINDLLGKTVSRPRRVKTRQVVVSVVHGDLRYAKYPVMVGHYEGDTIGGSERYLDRKLRGQLMRHYQFGNYPGALGRSLTVVPHWDRHLKQFHLPVGALVIGSGRMGELSSGQLTQAVRDGVIDYAFEMASRHEFEDSADLGSRTEQLGVSLLIIGSQTTPMMTTEDGDGEPGPGTFPVPVAGGHGGDRRTVPGFGDRGLERGCQRGARDLSGFRDRVDFRQSARTVVPASQRSAANRPAIHIPHLAPLGSHGVAAARHPGSGSELAAGVLRASSRSGAQGASRRRRHPQRIVPNRLSPVPSR
jgi:hypothetical protein